MTAFVVAVATPSLSSQTPRPTYPASASSITVAFAAPADFSNLQTTLKLLAAVNGGPANAFTVDTGSVGVVLPAAEIPGFNPTAPGNTPGRLRYTSSGLTLDGFWTNATVRFLNPSTRQPLAEATVQVLAVTAGSCQGGGPNAGRCTGAIPHMLGVGFGRGGDAANGMGTEAANPFVNLTAMNMGETGAAPAMRHGYLITHDGITFGLTGPETLGYQFVKLTPAAVPAPSTLSSFAAGGGPASAPAHSNAVISTGTRESAANRGGSGETPVFAPAHTRGHTRATPTFNNDWQTAPGFLTLGTHVFPLGTILIDTGLTNMIVEEPNEPTSGDLPTGQSVTIHLLGDQLRYGFTTGNGTTAVSPRRATWAAYTHGPFINTGLRALACFDYLYDADNGYLGLRPTCTTK